MQAVPRGLRWALAGFFGGALLLLLAILAFRAADHRSVEHYVSKATGCPAGDVRVAHHLPSLFEDEYEVEACGRSVTVRCAAQDPEGCAVLGTAPLAP